MERYCEVKKCAGLPDVKAMAGWGLTTIIDAVDRYILVNSENAAKILAAQKGYKVIASV